MRPYLDYCSQAWRPYWKKDIDKLERVQSRATKMVDECKGMTYEARLKEVNLTTLETRRLQADLLEVYRLFRNEDSSILIFFIRMEG